MTHRLIKKALLIRSIEEKFLELFSQGKLNGTVHTCVGQEFSAVAFAGQLKRSDFIFSNHRCHGHYIAFTNDVEGILAELMGKKNGTCGGVGSSQHLCKNNFFSNGVQGGIVPLAAGFSLAQKLKNTQNIGIVFIGDGTLGEGVVYETLNIISKWEIPLMIVCENNFYAQSTHFTTNLSGDILKRAEAFGIKTFKSDTWNIEQLFENAGNSIEYVRKNCKPAFHLVDTYRLNAHSKGDDDRDKTEIEQYRQKDFLNQFKENEPKYYKIYIDEISKTIERNINHIINQPELTLNEYFETGNILLETTWIEIQSTDKRQVELINQFFIDKMETDMKTVFIGEDVLSPYGGAFKVARNLSNKFPDRVFSTPISEASISGIANGLALAGFKPYIEIMFGDFMTLAFDQIVNHASKFYHMYNHQVTCPVVFRTPMGGRRGYGPTHSQSLEKFLIGIDNVKVIALNTFLNPIEIYQQIHQEKHPVIVIENKTDYGKKIGTKKLTNFAIRKSNHLYPIIKISPLKSKPTATLITYGGSADLLADCLEDIFIETEIIPEVYILSQINPIDIEPLILSINQTKILFTIEEGSELGGIGSEIIAKIMENTTERIVCKRIGALPVPIASVKSLENQILPDKQRIINTIISKINS